MTGINLIISEPNLDITAFWSHEADWINLVQDYGIDFDDTNHPIPAFHCLCGSQFCRGNRSDILLHEWVSYSPFLILISSLNKIHISRALDGHYLKGCFLDEASCNSRRIMNMISPYHACPYLVSISRIMCVSNRSWWAAKIFWGNLGIRLSATSQVGDSQSQHYAYC